MRSLGVALVAEACTDLFGLYVSILDMDIKWERSVCVCVRVLHAAISITSSVGQ